MSEDEAVLEVLRLVRQNLRRASVLLSTFEEDDLVLGYDILRESINLVSTASHMMRRKVDA